MFPIFIGYKFLFEFFDYHSQSKTEEETIVELTDHAALWVSSLTPNCFYSYVFLLANLAYWMIDEPKMCYKGANILFFSA